MFWALHTTLIMESVHLQAMRRAAADYMDRTFGVRLAQSALAGSGWHATLLEAFARRSAGA